MSGVTGTTKSDTSCQNAQVRYRKNVSWDLWWGAWRKFVVTKIDEVVLLYLDAVFWPNIHGCSHLKGAINAYFHPWTSQGLESAADFETTSTRAGFCRFQSSPHRIWRRFCLASTACASRVLIQQGDYSLTPKPDCQTFLLPDFLPKMAQLRAGPQSDSNHRRPLTG